MNSPLSWLAHLAKDEPAPRTPGLVAVAGDAWRNMSPDHVAVMERAAGYEADFVFFGGETAGRGAIPEALVYLDDGRVDEDFAQLHRRLWSWGGVPLVYRRVDGRVDLLRCAHKPDFLGRDGSIVYRAFKTLSLLTEIDSAVRTDPWWSAEFLREGALWDKPEVCNQLLSLDGAAHRSLIRAVGELDEDIRKRRISLPAPLARRLLVLSLLIAYLEARGVLTPAFFAKYKNGARGFFGVLTDGPAVVRLLRALERRFNGDVFSLSVPDRERLAGHQNLNKFAELVEGKRDRGGQLSFWKLYSFRDLPVELVSHIYERFVGDDRGSVYTPPFLVRLLLDEALGWEKLDEMDLAQELILDPACGSGVFLVEAYKRLILHWRYRNGWKLPDAETLKTLLRRVRGVDKNHDAIELAAFSLCLALCEALDTDSLRTAKKMFPPLKGVTLHSGCFFGASGSATLSGRIGVVVGNPPFESEFTTSSALDAARGYAESGLTIPDKQLAYLFLLEAKAIVSPGGTVCMIQPCGLMYNSGTAQLRRKIFAESDVREILDFVSIRSLFTRDTKVVAVLAEKRSAPAGRCVLHATFRRTGRVKAQHGFDIDYYDLHQLAPGTDFASALTWRANLLGGGRALSLAKRLRKFRTLHEYAESLGWDCGEGYITGKATGKARPSHLLNKRFLKSTFLGETGIDKAGIGTDFRPVAEVRSESRFTAPMLLIRENEALYRDCVLSGYLTYSDQIVGFCGKKKHREALLQVKAWIDQNERAVQAYAALVSEKLFVKKATAIAAADIYDIPFPLDGNLLLSGNETIVVDDIVDFMRSYVRHGDDAMQASSLMSRMAGFVDVYVRQLSAVHDSIRALPAHQWPGVLCQPFVFGSGDVDWSGVEQLRERIARLLGARRRDLHIRRVARIYDGEYIFLVKPDCARFWLRSIALRDADETLVEMSAQGF